MNANLYSNAKFSITKFLKELGQQMVPPISTFIDLDAHAEVDTLPKQDFICTSAFSIQLNGKELMVFVGVGIGVWNDPDITRLTTNMNTIVNAFLPEKQVPLWNGTNFSKWLVAADDLGVSPTLKSDQRAIQQAFVRLLTIPTN